MKSCFVKLFSVFLLLSFIPCVGIQASWEDGEYSEETVCSCFRKYYCANPSVCRIHQFYEDCTFVLICQYTPCPQFEENSVKIIDNLIEFPTYFYQYHNNIDMYNLSLKNEYDLDCFETDNKDKLSEKFKKLQKNIERNRPFNREVRQIV
ncbi:MAG: hypothetical protein ACI9S8_002362 [Chlamydiales bacterium]|jgi:hypothetical protein